MLRCLVLESAENIEFVVFFVCRLRYHGHETIFYPLLAFQDCHYKVGSERGMTLDGLLDYKSRILLSYIHIGSISLCCCPG